MKIFVLIMPMLLAPLQSFAQPNDGVVNRALFNREFFEIDKGRPTLTLSPAEMKKLDAKLTQVENRISLDLPKNNSVFINYEKDTKIEDQVWRLTEGSIDKSPENKNVLASTTTLYQDGIRSKTLCLSLDTSESDGTSLDCVTATSRLCESIKNNLRRNRIDAVGAKRIQDLAGQCQYLSQLVTKLYADPQFPNQYDEVVKQDLAAIEFQMKQTSLKKKDAGFTHSVLESLGLSSDIKVKGKKADDLAKSRGQIKQANLDLALMGELIATCNETKFGEKRAFGSSSSSGSGATGRK